MAGIQKKEKKDCCTSEWQYEVVHAQEHNRAKSWRVEKSDEPVIVWEKSEMNV